MGKKGLTGHTGGCVCVCVLYIFVTTIFKVLFVEIYVNVVFVMSSEFNSG